MVSFSKTRSPPIEIAKVKENAALVAQIESKIKEEQTIIGKIGTYFVKNTCFQHDDDSAIPMRRRNRQYACKTIKH